ncbi:hypothetical protein HK405_008810 [Cladochytrium tenue]|nr:hypothetical protein HK405_008810 [Cladochytrium tenue]
MAEATSVASQPVIAPLPRRVALLGVGELGLPISKNLVAALSQAAAAEDPADVSAALPLLVWSRTADSPRVRAAVEAGARQVDTVAEAVALADVVLDITFDAASLTACFEDALQGTRARGADAPPLTYVSCGTVNPQVTRSLVAKAKAAGVNFVTAAIFGRPEAAAAKALVWSVGGSSDLKEAIKPLLLATGRAIIDCGDDPAAGHALKVCGNYFLINMAGALGESFGLARASGVSGDIMVRFIEEMLPAPLPVAYARRTAAALAEGNGGGIVPSSNGADIVSKDLGIAAAMAEAPQPASPAALVRVWHGVNCKCVRCASIDRAARDRERALRLPPPPAQQNTVEDLTSIDAGSLPALSVRRGQPRVHSVGFTEGTGDHGLTGRPSGGVKDGENDDNMERLAHVSSGRRNNARNAGYGGADHGVLSTKVNEDDEDGEDFNGLGDGDVDDDDNSDDVGDGRVPSAASAAGARRWSSGPGRSRALIESGDNKEIHSRAASPSSTPSRLPHRDRGASPATALHKDSTSAPADASSLPVSTQQHVAPRPRSPALPLLPSPQPPSSSSPRSAAAGTLPASAAPTAALAHLGAASSPTPWEDSTRVVASRTAGPRTQFRGRVFHAGCLTCAGCSDRLPPMSQCVELFDPADSLLCMPCYRRRRPPPQPPGDAGVLGTAAGNTGGVQDCKACGLPCEDDATRILACGGVFHHGCLRCKTCDRPLRTPAFLERGSDAYCPDHFYVGRAAAATRSSLPLPPP